mmetsp:Transcript_82364/g.130244  ORF Transcript_82364/g.130244 Transcript_82364/m.130244 type:complete len:225 (+) Transcript_82364:291-965(+)
MVGNGPHLSEAFKAPRLHHHPLLPAMENGVAVEVEGRPKELDMAITVAVVMGCRVVAAMGTPPTAVTMKTVQRIPEKTRQIQPYALMKRCLRYRVVQERRLKMATEQMAMALKVQMATGEETLMVPLYPHSHPCFPKQATFHCARPSCHLRIHCQPMHSILQVHILFQWSCTQIFHYQHLPHKWLMAMHRCHFQWYSQVLRPMVCLLTYQVPALVFHCHMYMQG